jgi:Protein of unknown function (DUF3037)
MASRQGYYALLQYGPAPERQEFVNIGVALFVPEQRDVRVRFSRTQKRVEKLFGRQSKGFLDALKAGIEKRLQTEFSEDFDVKRFQAFAKTRANKLRIASILPILIDEPRSDLDELFQELVGDEEPVRRRHRINFELKNKFEQAGVSKYIQRRPSPVQLPQGVTIEAPYAYRNGAFNLIDPVRLSGDASEALAQATKRAVESHWLRQYSQQQGDPKDLVVVGDFHGQRRQFVNAVKQLMADGAVTFYDMRAIDPLIEDIRKNASQQALFAGSPMSKSPTGRR